MTDCIVKQYGCSCPPDACSVRPVSPAPFVSFPPRVQLATIAFGVFVALLVAGGMHALNRMEIQLAQEARI